MEKIIIGGKRELVGETEVQGSKNALLPILAACVVAEGESVIHNCPILSDVEAAVEILRHIGCKVKRVNSDLYIDSTELTCYNIPNELMHKMRSSIVFLGALLSRMKKARMTSPGGCEIGLRPIDLHLSSLEALGVRCSEKYGDIICSAEKGIKPAVISLSFPSVGATENIILAAVKAKGRTVILNAAREPEIDDLTAFLNKCGAKIRTEKEGTVIIDGCSDIYGCEYTVMSDRIVCLTYMCCIGAAGGDLLLKNVSNHSFMSVIPVFEKAGCEIIKGNNSVRIISDGRLTAVKDIRTMPYPGFPTDAQAPVMAMLSVAKGTSVIVENIFESRFKHVSQLVRMGAKIRAEGRVAIIEETEGLHGAKVVATDLRGGAALVVAALAAEGTTEISGLWHIDRGYEKITEHLKSLGADIERREEVNV